MTDQDQHFQDDVHALSGAYAVDALDDVERRRFEEHLRHCSDCRAEVDSLRETAGLLGSDDLVAPPASMRDQVLAGIAGIRPLPPETSPVVETGDDDLAARRARRTRRLPGAGLLLAAAAVVLIAAAGITSWVRGPDEGGAGPTVAEQVLVADDALRVEKKFPGGAMATVVVSRDVGRAVILTEDMPGAPEGRDYQLWLQTPAGEMQPAGLMPDTRDATVLLDGEASRATGVGITVEPDGGSERPTTEPIAIFSLDA